MSPKSRAEALLAESIESSANEIDRFFAGLFLLQWASRIGLAWFRPTREDGLFTAIFVGAFIACVPTMLVVWKPGKVATRHAIAVAQMLYGGLAIYLTKGALEAHVHFFFSLAILSLYREPSVVVTAAIAGVAQSFVVSGAPTAFTETMWIASVGVVLFYAARRGRMDLALIAHQAAELEARSVAEPVVETPKSEAPVSAPPVSAPPVSAPPVSAPPVSAPPDSTQLLCLVPSIASSSRRIECSILLVEGDLENQKVLTNHLERAGVSVQIAPTGEAALSEVNAASERGKPFDLVLMDMHAPVVNGYEATAELRRRGYGAPIIAMKGDPRRSIDAGCTDILIKATSRDHLIQVVANHGLGSAATLPPPARVSANDDAIFSDHPESAEMQELLDAFVSRLHQNAHDVEAAETAGNMEEMELIAHRLRGAAGSFGFMAIGDAAGILEDAIQAGRPTTDPVAKLASLCRRAQARAFAVAA